MLHLLFKSTAVFSIKRFPQESGVKRDRSKREKNMFSHCASKILDNKLNLLLSQSIMSPLRMTPFIMKKRKKNPLILTSEKEACRKSSGA